MLLSKKYESFIEELKIQCPELPKDDLKDVTNDSGLSTLEDFTKWLNLSILRLKERIFTD